MRPLAAVKAALPARYKHAGRRAFLRVAAVTSAGEGVVCPCCGHTWRQFAWFYGARDQCPSCGSLMRHRALLLYLRDVMRIERRGGDVLHVGPSRALRDCLRALDTVRYLSLDLDSPLADVQADLTALSLDDASFDLVLCSHVLEHIPDDARAIAEMFRVLRPGGTAIVQLPPSELAETFEDESATTAADRERVFGQYDHVRICGADYGARLEAAGFAVETADYVRSLSQETCATFGLRVGEPFYVCTKPAADARAV